MYGGGAFSYDAAYTKGEIKSIEELNNDYKGIIAAGADIVEANLCIEVGNAIYDLQQRKLASSSKAKFF